MFDIGFGELLVCAIVALLVLGPERLPGAVRTVGRWVGRARHTVNQFTDQIDREIRAEELRRKLDEEVRKTGINDVARQVDNALRAPLPMIGAGHLRNDTGEAADDKPAAPTRPVLIGNTSIAGDPGNDAAAAVPAPDTPARTETDERKS